MLSEYIACFQKLVSQNAAEHAAKNSSFLKNRILVQRADKALFWKKKQPGKMLLNFNLFKNI